MIGSDDGMLYTRGDDMSEAMSLDLGSSIIDVLGLTDGSIAVAVEAGASDMVYVLSGTDLSTLASLDAFGDVTSLAALPVPEPTTLGLLAATGGALLLRRRPR